MTVSVSLRLRVSVIVVSDAGFVLITPSTTRKLGAAMISGGAYGFLQPIRRPINKRNNKILYIFLESEIISNEWNNSSKNGELIPFNQPIFFYKINGIRILPCR